MSDSIPSPLPWFGGKSAGADRAHNINTWLRSLLPVVEPGQTYVEAYAGMLGILLARPKAPTEVVNDLDERVHNFWRVLRDEHEELKRLLSATPHGKAVHAEACQILADEENVHTNVRRAWALVTGTRQSMSGIVAHSWSSGRGVRSNGAPHHWQTWTASATRVTSERLIERIRDIVLDQRDGAELVSYYAPNPHAVIYCDPPYSTGSYGYQAKADLEQLCEAVRDAQARILISGYESDPYDDLLDWQRHEYATTITVPQHGTRDRIECAWTNYEIAPPAQATLL